MALNKEDVEWVDYLFLGEAAYDVIMSYIDTFIYPNKPKDNDEDFSQSLVRYTYKSSLDIVFQFAESPIEKIFLNALLLQNLVSRCHGESCVKRSGRRAWLEQILQA